MNLSNDLVKACLFIGLLASVATANSGTRVFNVQDYGAVPDGQTDSTNAFHEAWKETCNFEGDAEMQAPEGNYFVGPLMFKGPCKRPVAFRMKGTLIATGDLNAFKRTEWIAFHYINGFLLTGGGTFDGRGGLSWRRNGCQKSKNCKRLPTNINFSFVNNATIEHITSLDSKFFHTHLYECENVKVHSVRFIAPDESPNTDGIHLGNSRNIEITDSKIETGDDCISIGPADKNITITNIACGPGHGISIGSLGANANEGDVVDVSVKHCTLTNTDNGVRIKTWPGSPPSVASNFLFEDIVMKNVSNPIIIDQKYCPGRRCNLQAASNVKISNVKFRNIRGDSRTRVAIKMVCSEAVPCQGIELYDVDLKYNGQGKTETTHCTDVQGSAGGTVNPTGCI